MHSLSHKTKSGFTLIELLVVISIIGLLASVVLVRVNSTRDKAKVAKVNADLQQLLKAAEMARGANNNILQAVTGSYWTLGDASGVCYVPATPRVLKNIPEADPCMTWLNGQFQKMGLAKAPRDPWGSPYYLDENEREGGVCNHDYFYSAGPDGLPNTADDYSAELSFYVCK